MLLSASPAARVGPRSAALRAPRRCGAASRSRAVCVAAAAKPVETMTLKDGRKVAVFASTADATSAVADAFVAAYNEVVPKKGSITIAIPSGSVVKALGALKGAPGVDFSKVHVYFTNERAGGKTFDGDRKDFLDPCGVPLANCHPITGLEDPSKGAAAYEAAMQADSKLPKVGGAPSFDIILLGTGDDGHCASINPGSAQVKATAGYVLPIPAGDKPGGATVSLALINAAARVVVSASEKKRAEMVKRALSGVFPAHECPAGLVKSAHGSTTWLCDVDSIAAYKAM